jgi:hypothetical protein
MGVKQRVQPDLVEVILAHIGPRTLLMIDDSNTELIRGLIDRIQKDHGPRRTLLVRDPVYNHRTTTVLFPEEDHP